MTRGLTTTEDDEPTEPRLAAQLRDNHPLADLLQRRESETCTFSLDAQGMVTICVRHQGVFHLRAEEAFDLLDFLFEHRDFLAARNAEQADL